MSCENEYIEREAIQRCCFIQDEWGEWILAEDIINLPAADVRPVVLCKDCKYSYEWANMDGDKIRYCSYLRAVWNHDTDRMVYDDDFCKWGVKREEIL